ncbi:MAG: FAD-dependent oxidoreductase [Mariprofundaceae bacterium]|nr:FAD-dependent oxidoreductase [Mariprofundaceae bacterium]
MDKNEIIYDVVIVGAGVLGCALALQLSQLGKQVALVDAFAAALQPSEPERVIALSEGSARYLQTLGVWQSLAGHGTGHIERIHVCEPPQSVASQAETRKAGTVDMQHTEINADALGYVVESRFVLQVLHAALRDKVDTFCPARCLSMQRDADGATTVQLDADGAVSQLRCQLVVGADGTNSQVRRLAGIQTRGWDHNRVAIVASLTAEKEHGGVAYECFRAEGPLALLPLADGRFSLVWSVAPQRAMQLMKLDAAAFMQALEADMGMDVMQQTGAWQAVGKRASFPLELRVAQSFAQAGIALIGNAAHTIHPVAGQGMNLGLRDVAVLVDVLQQTWAQGAWHCSMVAETYAERRRLDTLAVLGFTEGVLAAFAASCLRLPWLRGQALRGLQATPSLKQVLLQQASGLAQLQGGK